MRPRLWIGLSLLLALMAPAFGGDTKAPFKATPFEGRKGKSDRVVVMELFTGAQCPPCVAADMAFDVLAETYKTSDLVQLQYHMHIPGPDPMTNPDTIARWDYYRKAFPAQMRGVPSSLFNGKPAAGGGGGAAAAEKKYLAYREVIDPLLEEAAVAKIVASATRKGDKIEVKAEVSGLANPGADKRLRLVLVEKSIKYTGGNKLPVHHQVVRALLGGPNGFALEAKDSKHTATVDLMELRQGLNRYLDEFAAKRAFPNKNRPLDFNALRVVAFVQNDDNQEILQGVQVDVNDR
ncbi:MAG TPA: hypothetical protein VEL76_16325 [Gemmataceae bacterium]|nr:hypothetical protein [Gemmataceae bacterium]